MVDHPKISFVIAARNAEHDDTFLTRLRTVLRILNVFVARHHLSAEFVIVQYNPPVSKPLLERALADLPVHALSVRVITVPETFHARIAPGRKGPFLEYVAKNIGIRRAIGEYILVTNLDIVFSEEMITRLTGPLTPDVVYRANRHDLGIYEIPDAIGVDDAVALCKKSTNRIWTSHGLLYTSWPRWWHRFMRRPRLRNLLMAPMFNSLRTLFPPRTIHDAAAGDFVLAHHNAWAQVRGYSQDLVDAHLDGYNIAMFVCHGFRQVILDEPIFHINHTQNPSREMPDVKKYKYDLAVMAKTRKPYTEYSENWGFPKEHFPESLVQFR